MTQNQPEASHKPTGIDPRGPRVGAAVTSVLLIVGVYLALVGVSTGGSLGGLPLFQRAGDAGFIVQLVVAMLFAWSLVSARTQPLSVFFRRVVQPKLQPPSGLEDPRPPRFAQLVGLLVVGIGLVLHLFGVPWALVIAGGAAFVAAFLNASIGFCLGCELYLLIRRLGSARSTAQQ